MKTTKRAKELKDFLDELDECLHDNSIEEQAKTQHVLDLVHNPTQFSGIDVEYALTQSFRGSIEAELRMRLAEMARKPQADDAEPTMNDSEFMYCDFEIGAHPDYTRDWGEYNDTPTAVIVDGNLYTITKHDSFYRMAWTKEIVQWETKPAQPQAVILAQEPAMTAWPQVVSSWPKWASS